VMLVPYPPGIPVRMPGERLGGAEGPTIQLILALQEFGKRFPGFEREVHGIEVDANGDYWVRAVIESAATGPRGNGHREKPPTSAPPVKKRRSKVEKPKPPSPPAGTGAR